MHHPRNMSPSNSPSESRKYAFVAFLDLRKRFKKNTMYEVREPFRHSPEWPTRKTAPLRLCPSNPHRTTHVINFSMLARKSHASSVSYPPPRGKPHYSLVLLRRPISLSQRTFSNALRRSLVLLLQSTLRLEEQRKQQPRYQKLCRRTDLHSL